MGDFSARRGLSKAGRAGFFRYGGARRRRLRKTFRLGRKKGIRLERVASEVGFETNVAVAGSPLAAVCAAQGFAGVTVIPAGEEGLRIGRLSLEALRIPLAFVEILKRWGIRTCADFAVLPEISIVERLGQEGLHWWRLARGAEVHPLIAKNSPSNFEEHLDLDSPVEFLEPLLFVLNRLLEQLCARLRSAKGPEHFMATPDTITTAASFLCLTQEGNVVDANTKP